MPTLRSSATGDRLIAAAASAWRDAVDELVALQSEYTQWFEALPEPLRDTATGEALQALVDFQLDELLGIEPPHGFGRD